MSFKTRFLAFSSLFICVVLVNILAIIQQQKLLHFIAKPLIVLSVLVMYVGMSERKRRLYIISLCSVFIADIFYLFEATYFRIAMVFFIINHILLALEVITFTKKIEIATVLKYFSVLVFALIIIYIYILKDQKGNDVSILIFGVTLCFLVALALANYLEKMSAPNFYLISGLLIGLIANVIISLNAFNLSSDILISLLSTMLLAGTHSVTCYSFIIRDKNSSFDDSSF